MTIDDFEEYAKSHDCVIFTRQQYEHVIDVFNNYELLLFDYYGRLKFDMVDMFRSLWNDIENLDAPICDYASSDCISKWQVHELIQQKINELKQEPTTKNDLGVDAISRADARSLICNIDIKYHLLGMTRKVFKDLYNGIDDLPSVTPQERKGHWIYDYTSADGHRTYHCSECGCYLQPKHSEPLRSFKWCSLCGAKMVEPQDSEVDEGI